MHNIINQTVPKRTLSTISHLTTMSRIASHTKMSQWSAIKECGMLLWDRWKLNFWNQSRTGLTLWSQGCVACLASYMTLVWVSGISKHLMEGSQSHYVQKFIVPSRGVWSVIFTHRDMHWSVCLYTCLTYNQPIKWYLRTKHYHYEQLLWLLLMLLPSWITFNQWRLPKHTQIIVKKWKQLLSGHKKDTFF